MHIQTIRFRKKPYHRGSHQIFVSFQLNHHNLRGPVLPTNGSDNGLNPFPILQRFKLSTEHQVGYVFGWDYILREEARFWQRNLNGISTSKFWLLNMTWNFNWQATWYWGNLIYFRSACYYCEFVIEITRRDLSTNWTYMVGFFCNARGQKFHDKYFGCIYII